jgi:pimeloyl-ACP methyl ester carboxylesterase
VVGIAAVLLGGCAQVVPGVAVPDPAGSAPPGLEAFYDQQLAWGPCAPFAATEEDRQIYADPSLQCARMQVPLDYAAPEGRTGTIAVLRHAAPASPQRIGSLVINPGGPGASGIQTAAYLSTSLASTEVGRRFDVVGFDPRGVGESEPTIRCLEGPERDADRSDDDTDSSPAGVAQTEAEERETVDRCAQRTGPDVLANVGTRDVARDMDVLRAALGEQVMTYYGASYGTQLGSTYAELFPERVGRLVLDGAVDPTLTVREEALTQAAGFETALGAYVQNCIDSTDSCFLGSTVDEGLQRISDLIDQVDAEPLVVGDRELTAGLAVYGIITPLYNRDYWILLSQGLQAAFDGDGSVLLQLADAYASRDSDGGYADNSMEAFPAISCLDDPSGIRPAQVPGEIPEFEEASPTFGRIYAWGLISCRNWPAARGLDPEPLTIDAAGAAPIVVVGTTRDPATPYAWAEALAAQLDSGVLVTRDGDGHTGYNSGNECTSEAVESYLIEGKVPRDGLTC